MVQQSRQCSGGSGSGGIESVSVAKSAIYQFGEWRASVCCPKHDLSLGLTAKPALSAFTLKINAAHRKQFCVPRLAPHPIDVPLGKERVLQAGRCPGSDPDRAAAHPVR